MSTSPETGTVDARSELPDSFASLMTNDGIEVREGFAEVSDNTTLHYADAGEELERYVEARSQPGAAAAMINYYRASVRASQKEAKAAIRPISAPTLAIRGQHDATSVRISRSPSMTTCPTSRVSNVCRMRRTGSITTRSNASTSC